MKRKEEEKNPVEICKEYLPPQIEVTHVEMEHGIAAASANVVPAMINGDTAAPLPTEWEGTDTPSIETPF
ncbi:TPA: hypothetical protein ACWX1I_003231 [Elizabethkingia anophelis]